MTTGIYHRLAEHLDNLPAGYPTTESGVEIRILRRLFTPEEAEVATGMSIFPRSVLAIARAMERDEGELAPLLESMSRKGLIFRMARRGKNHYMAAQFIIGIWEYHVNDLDEDLIRDVNEYLPYITCEAWANQETRQLRIIPVSQQIAVESAITSYELAEEIIREQSKIVVSPCICRKEHHMVGHGCDKPVEVCLSFGAGATYYDENGLGRVIDQVEAIQILNIGREAGLVLQPGNAQKPAHMCMCCGCCCQVLKNLKTLDRPGAAVHTNYYAEVTTEDCLACGDCLTRCQMDAITMEDTARVNPDRCIGCGLCVSVCPTGALTYRRKEKADLYTPPETAFDTYVKMARERGRL